MLVVGAASLTYPLKLGYLDDTSHLGRKGCVFEEQAGVDWALSMLKH